MTIDLSETPLVSGPSNVRVPRRAGSVRRTASIDAHWPGGRRAAMRLQGRARDLLTPADGSDPRVLAQDVVYADVATDRTIETIRADPVRPGIAQLVGLRPGGTMRGALATVIPHDYAVGSPLHLLLDDFAGATFIARFAHKHWPDPDAPAGQGRQRRQVVGLCTGFAPGSSAITAQGTSADAHLTREVPSAADPADPIGWHSFVEHPGMAFRRVRRIDVHLTDVLVVDAFFQDSVNTPSGTRMAIHEYQVQATVDPVSSILLSVSADPRVLPYLECPLAVRNINQLVGSRLTELRETVLTQLRGTAGCTHLNDTIRALADVRSLAGPL